MSMDEEPLTDLTGQEAPEKEEFHICTALSDFPVSDCPAFLREGVGGVCIIRTYHDSGTRQQIPDRAEHGFHLAALAACVH